MSKVLKLIDLIDLQEKKTFYSSSVFHERQMNSCPIGCEGCAVSASSSTKGAMNFNDLYDFYKDAESMEVSLKITKVEGYDPVFVNYKDSDKIPFAASVKTAIDAGHTIITPVCTTGSWKSDRTKWQLEELGKLGKKYRSYTYPSGNYGSHFVLSIPRQIKPFLKGKYDFSEHVKKIVLDIQLLTINGDLEVLIYYNSAIPGDFEVAEDIKNAVGGELSQSLLERVDLIVTNFNNQTIPESCFRYPNSMLVCDKGFVAINQTTMDWSYDPNLSAETQLQTGFALA